MEPALVSLFNGATHSTSAEGDVNAYFAYTTRPGLQFSDSSSWEQIAVSNIGFFT